MKATIILEDGRQIVAEVDPTEFEESLPGPKRSEVWFDWSVFTECDHFDVNTDERFWWEGRIEERDSSFEPDWSSFIHEDDAKTFDERMMALWRIKKWIARNCSEFVPDLADSQQGKYSIFWSDMDWFNTGSYWRSVSNPDLPFLPSKDMTSRCIKECEQDLKTYFRIK